MIPRSPEKLPDWRLQNNLIAFEWEIGIRKQGFICLDHDGTGTGNREMG